MPTKMKALLSEIEQCQTKHEEMFGHIIHELETLLQDIHVTQTAIKEDALIPWEQHVENLGARAGALGSVAKVTKEYRSYLTAYTKLGKKISTTFPDDFDLASASDNSVSSVFGKNGSGLRDGGPVAAPLSAFISQHLLSSGLFDQYETFSNECQEKFSSIGCSPPRMSEPYCQAFKDLREVISALENRDPEPALGWFNNNKNGASRGDEYRRLVLELHSLKFVEMLRDRGAVPALMYGRQHLQPFLKDYRQEVATLFAATSMPLEAGPYKELLNPDRWLNVIQQVQRVYCREHDATSSHDVSSSSAREESATPRELPVSPTTPPVEKPSLPGPAEPPPLPPFPVVLDTPLQPSLATSTTAAPSNRNALVRFPELQLTRPVRPPAPVDISQIWGLERRTISETSGRFIQRITGPPIVAAWTPELRPTFDRRMGSTVESSVRLSSKETSPQCEEVQREESENKRQKVGLPRYSLLSVTLTAGLTALPKVLQYFQVLQIVDPLVRKASASDNAVLPVNKKVLPVEIDLSACFAFHTTFTCAVTLTHTSRFNPPYLLQCGHVISKVCMDRLSAASRGRNFKCPLCRQHQTTMRVRRLSL